MCLSRNSSAKVEGTIRDVFSKHYFVFSFDLSPGITMLTFFLSIAHFWLSPGTLALV